MTTLRLTRSARTAPLTEPEKLTQQKSKRLIEGFVSNGLLRGVSHVRTQ